MTSLTQTVHLCFVGDGADAALQPEVGGGDEEQAEPGEGSSAQDSAQRGQDPHGHVQEEPSDQRRRHRHPGAGERACEAGTDSMGWYGAEKLLYLYLLFPSQKRPNTALSSLWNR